MSETKPVLVAPSLWSWNGIGLRLVGRRDYEPVTDSWVMTRCFCLFYLPVLALDAYRVREAGVDWQFLDRAKRSPLALGGSLVVLGACLCAAVWAYQVYTQAHGSSTVATTDRPSALLPTDRAPSTAMEEGQAAYQEALTLLGSVLREVLADELDVDLLKPLGHPLLLLGLLYEDEASQTKLTERLQGKENYVKALRLLEQAVQVPDQQQQAGMVLYLFRSLARDQAALQRQVTQLGRPWADLPVPPDLLATYQGQRDGENRQQLHAALERSAAQLPLARQSAKKKTAAAILKELARLKMQLYHYGESVGTEEVVTWAEAAVQLAPSTATREVLLDALLLRVHLRLTEQAQEYATLTAPLRRSVATRQLIALGLDRLPALRAVVRDDVDLRRVVTLLQDHARRFPHALSPSGWALLRHTELAAAAAWARELQRDLLGRLERQLLLHLSPWTTPGLMNTYWALLLEGKEADAAALLRQARAKGVPVPQ